VLTDAQQARDERTRREWEHRRERWMDVTAAALRSIFTGDEAADEVERTAVIGMVIGDAEFNFRTEREGHERALNKLLSLRDRLEYLDPPANAASTPVEAEVAAPSETAQVFLVHGRDDALKTRVARVLEKTGEHPITILHEQANEGSRTIIEKFEHHAAQVDYAVVLLTADDVGGMAGQAGIAPDGPDGQLRPRARQNVVLELGYFAGSLGRGRVSVLYEEDVEMPSDYTGVAYTPLDPGGRWEASLLRELRAAGLSFDLNKLV